MRDNFMGEEAPGWYKSAILAFLVLNGISLLVFGPFVTGWVMIAEFIFTLAMALKSYPLPAGGLIALEAVIFGLTSPDTVYHEVESNFPVLLLLMFMVAGIYFMRELLLIIFSTILVRIRSKVWLSFLFAAIAAALSAFLDALTVVAIVIAVGTGFYTVYHRFASRRGEEEHHDHRYDEHIHHEHREELEQFRSFLRSLLMHAAVGTALGGVCTLVGEPQNLIIGHVMEWDFITFARKMAPVSIPVLLVGLTTTVILEKLGWFGYGAKLPETVRYVMKEYVERENETRDAKASARLIIQAISAVVLVVSLATHVAEVGLVGLTIIILLTAFNGETEEHRIGQAFTESLPFAGLLVVFFAIVAMIHDQQLFAPIIDWTLGFEGRNQVLAFFGASGGLSSSSDNVFVGTVFITEAKTLYEGGQLTRAQFEEIAVGINAGTNILSVATPNGQAAFLFLLTSPVAALIRLSYGRMLWMAVPYTVTLLVTAFMAIAFLL
jgi:NhaB family Na+:H+ antiporter